MKNNININRLQHFASHIRDKSNQESTKWSAILSHPAEYEEYQRHYYKNYANNHVHQLLANPQLTRGQSLMLMKQLISKWTPIQKIIATLILIAFVYTVVISFI